MIIALAVALVGGITFESVWQERDCAGSPQSMAIYDETVVMDSLAILSSSDYVPPVCGYSPVAINAGCCASTWKPELTGGFQSWYEQLVPSMDTIYAPVSSNGYSYCALYALDANSLYQYKSMYTLANGKCTIDGIKCSPKGLVTIYTDSTCQTVSMQYQLASLAVLPQSVLGNVTGEFLTITNGTQTFTWVAYSPEIYSVPSTYAYLLPFEYFSFTLNYLAMIISVYFFDTVPQLVLVATLVRNQQLRSKGSSFPLTLLKFLQSNIAYTCLVLVHLCNMITFLIITYLTTYSQLLGNDRILLAMGGPLVFVDVLHSLLNASILGELKEIISSLTNNSKKSTFASRLKSAFVNPTIAKSSTASQSMARSTKERDQKSKIQTTSKVARPSDVGEKSQSA